jgi:RNA recognition motif-containing protein
MDEVQKNKLYVGNLPYTMDDEGLSKLFSDVEGVEVTEAKVILDKMSEERRSRGFGFITVADDSMAEIAIKELNGKDIDGRQIFVNVARPQKERNDR